MNDGAARSGRPAAASRREATTIPGGFRRSSGACRRCPPETLRLLGVISLALLFENFDQAALTAALKQIAAGFAVAEADLGRTLGFVHLGALPAFLLVPFADRIGRRRLFLISVIGISIASCASAFASSIVQFVAMQMVSRVFMVTCSAMAFVIITEEFPAAHRGWGIGIASAVGAFGVALALLLFAAIDWLPFGWRSLYALGILPLLLLPLFRREIRETRRFVRHRGERAADGPLLYGLAGWWKPMWDLLRAYPGRAAGIGLIAVFASAGHAAVYGFSSYFVQSVHGWAPGRYTAMMIAAGLVGIVGFPIAGRLADSSGRRRVGFLVLAGFPLFGFAFYQGPGWVLPFVWVPHRLHAHRRQHDPANARRRALPDFLPGHLGGLGPARGVGGSLGRTLPRRLGHRAGDRHHDHDQRWWCSGRCSPASCCSPCPRRGGASSRRSARSADPGLHRSLRTPGVGTPAIARVRAPRGRRRLERSEQRSAAAARRAARRHRRGRPGRSRSRRT